MYNNQNRQNPNYVRRNNNGNGYVNQPNPNQNPNYPNQNGNYGNPNYGNGNSNFVPTPNFNPNFIPNNTNQNQMIADTNLQTMPPIAPAPPVIKATKQQHPVSAYLAEVTSFCTQLNAGEVKMLPKHLTLSEAVEIVVVADRLQVSRMDALKSWKVCNKGIIISAEFLASLLESRKLITAQISYLSKSDSCKVSFNTTSSKITGEEITKANAIENSLWDKDLPLALKEVALMSGLRKGFPQLTMSIISPAEVENSNLDKAKRLIVKFYRKTISFFRSCFTNDSIAEVANASNTVNSDSNSSNEGTSNINIGTTTTTNIIESKSNSVENSASKTCINLEKDITNTTQVVPKTIKLSPTKTNSIVEVEEDSFFLDLSELEIKRKNKVTSRIN